LEGIPKIEHGVKNRESSVWRNLDLKRSQGKKRGHQHQLAALNFTLKT